VAYEIEELHLAPQPVASTLVPGIGAGAVGAALHGTLPDIFSHLHAGGVAMVGAPFARYHSGADGTIDLEAGIPVGGPFVETDTIRARELPGGDAIATVHVGAYDRLPEALAALAAWRASHGRGSAGAYWEIYVDDPSTVPAEQVRTQLVEPLRPKA
jgi:effector-binding domain-containing protein